MVENLECGKEDLNGLLEYVTGNDVVFSICEEPDDYKILEVNYARA